GKRGFYKMHKEVFEPINRETLGKGVFQPSRAAIAREMECRLKLGEAHSERQSVAVASRH
ncbi:MAG: hypothetical protein M3448_02405, partial [Pseudomonadota bacterium]|nr:hypothetical protein [Pseudomonadota bacterium]